MTELIVSVGVPAGWLLPNPSNYGLTSREGVC